MKKILVLLGAVMLFSGCGMRQSAEDKIMTALNDMTGYEAVADLTRISNKGTNTYGTLQSYRSEDGAYRMEVTSPDSVKGNYTVFDGTRVAQYNPKVDSSIVMDVPASQPRNELFLGQFMTNFNSETGAVTKTEELDGAECLLLETTITGENKYLSFEKLWVDLSTGEPVKMMIFDADGQERYIVEYSEFAFDPTFAEGTFAIPAQ